MADAKADKAVVDDGSAAAERSRRDFLKSIPWLTVAWVSFTGAIGATLLGTLRFLFPNVLYEPPQQFKVGLPEAFQVGEVSEMFKDRYGVWVVRSEQGFYALIAVCTHLGCTPNWQAGESKFKCPCHGSGFYTSGVNFEGPAPRPLERAAVSLADDGQIVVDKSRQFLFERGGWEDPDSFLPYTA